jgi:hypothetical protein
MLKICASIDLLSAEIGISEGCFARVFGMPVRSFLMV